MRLGIAIVGLIAAGIAALFVQKRQRDGRGERRRQREERPPIRVRNKKLFFDHEKTWRAEGGSRKWRLNHPQGDPTSSFEVTLITPPKTFPSFHARVVTIDVMIDGSARPFQLQHEGFEPSLTSAVELETTNGGKRLKFKIDKEVWISRVLGDGVVKYEFQSSEPAITFDVQPQR